MAHRRSENNEQSKSIGAISDLTKIEDEVFRALAMVGFRVAGQSPYSFTVLFASSALLTMLVESVMRSPEEISPQWHALYPFEITVWAEEASRLLPLDLLIGHPAIRRRQLCARYTAARQHLGVFTLTLRLILINSPCTYVYVARNPKNLIEPDQIAKD